MGKVYGPEELLADVKSTLSANLNAKIAEINAEKSDAVILKNIDAAAYIQQTLDSRETNMNPFMFYGIDDIQSDSRGPVSSKKLTVFAIIVVEDNGQDVNISTRMLRYLRAIEEVFKGNWNNNGGAKIEVKSLVPVPLPNLNSSNPSRATGVQIEANIG